MIFAITELSIPYKILDNYFARLNVKHCGEGPYEVHSLIKAYLGAGLFQYLFIVLECIYARLC